MGLSQAKMAQRLIKLHLPQWQSSLAVGAGLLCLSVYSSLIIMMAVDLFWSI